MAENANGQMMGEHHIGFELPDIPDSIAELEEPGHNAMRNSMNGITETSAHDAFDSGSSLDLNAERRASHSTTCSDSANDDDTGAEAGRPSPVNKKRARATREQLAILEDTFLTNTSPNAKLRAILSKKLNMTERSIQIWFQNRRAKVKLMQRRAAQQAATEQALRQQSYLAAAYGMRAVYPTMNMQYSHPARSASVDFSNMLGGLSLNTNVHGQMGQPNNMGPMPGMAGSADQRRQMETTSLCPPGQKAEGMNFAITFPTTTFPVSAESLAIGVWRRVPITMHDLVISYNSVTRTFKHQIGEGASKFKMEFPSSSVSSVALEQVDAFTGQLTLDLNAAPAFFMEMNVNGNNNMMGGLGPNSPLWTRCRDFTEHQQASCVTRHVIRGRWKVIFAEVSALIQSDSYLTEITRIKNMLVSTPGVAAQNGAMAYNSEANGQFAGTPLSGNEGISDGMFPPMVRRHSTPTVMLQREPSLHESLLRRPTLPGAFQPAGQVDQQTSGMARIRSMSHDFPSDMAMVNHVGHVRRASVAVPQASPPTMTHAMNTSPGLITSISKTAASVPMRKSPPASQKPLPRSNAAMSMYRPPKQVTSPQMSDANGSGYQQPNNGGNMMQQGTNFNLAMPVTGLDLDMSLGMNTSMEMQLPVMADASMGFGQPQRNQSSANNDQFSAGQQPLGMNYTSDPTSYLLGGEGFLDTLNDVNCAAFPNQASAHTSQSVISTEGS